MLRTHHLLKGITEEHQVELLCFSDAPPGNLPYRNTKVHYVSAPSFTKVHRAAALVQIMPIYPLANHSPSMSKLAQQICRSERPEVCHIDTLGMSSYVGQMRMPVVVDVMDCISLNFERLASIQTNPLRRILYRFEGAKIKRFERSVAEKAAALICCTQGDADCLKEVTGRNVLTIPNGVAAPESIEREIPRNPLILFVGLLDYSANRDALNFFGNHIWPLVLRSSPHAVFEIVGKGKHITFRDMTNVHYRGYVEDLGSAYKRASLVVAPLRSGTGVKNKVIEAMAHGVPVVATSLAAEGIGGDDGTHYLVAETAEEFAAGTLKLLSDPDLSRDVGLAARSHVCKNFDWNSSVAQLLDVYAGTRSMNSAKL